MASIEVSFAALELVANKKTQEEIKTLLAESKITVDKEKILLDEAALSKTSLEYIQWKNLDKKDINALLKELEKLNHSLVIKLGDAKTESDKTSDDDIGKEIEALAEDSAAADMNIPLMDFFNELADEVNDILRKHCIHLRILEKGCIEAPRVGDLIKVEKELKGYQMGEIAQIENIMASEKREFSVRDLTRLTEYTETLQEKEKENSESSKVDERFQLDTQTQKAQNQNIALSGSVNGKYTFPNGSIGISTSASYSSARQSSHNTSTQYAKNITEEASKRVREHIKEVKKVTVVTEQTKHSAHGFDNTAGPDGAGGTDHIVGIYRWVDKVYQAQTYDYGKRLFLEFMVPEPAFFLRDIRQKITQEETAGLEEPLHPHQYYTKKQNSNSQSTFRISDFKDVDHFNYEELCAYYEVEDFALEPPNNIYRTKSFAIPQEMTADDIEAQRDPNDLSIVKKLDMELEEGYRLSKVGAFIPEPKEVTAVALRMINETKIAQAKGQGSIQLLIANQTFTFITTVGAAETEADSGGGGGTGAARTLLAIATGGLSEHLINGVQVVDTVVNNRPLSINISHDFNAMRTVTPFASDIEWRGETAGQSSVPMSILCDFEGLFTFILVYEASRTPEFYYSWQKDTYNKIMQGYKRKYQEYLQRKREADLKKNSRVERLELKPRESKYREIESIELRKHCISLLTRNSAFIHLPNILYNRPLGYHYINTNNPIPTLPNWQVNTVNGVTADFFEDSFEWEQISYQFYPYYWADVPRWKDLYQESETGDDTFDKFLKSGYAKVVVPIRPNYEKPVLFYLKTNRIWRGGELPALNDLKFLSYLEELYDAKQLAKGEGEAIGQSWEIKLPTSFVILQSDGILPTDMYQPNEATDPSSTIPEKVIEDLTSQVEQSVEGMKPEKK